MKNVIYLLFSLVLFSCSKSKNLKDDRTSPLVNLVNPSDGQQFSAGSTFNISGTVEDENKIVQVHFHFSSLETGQLLADIHRYPGSSAFSFSENLQIPGSGDYRLQIIARDNTNNEGRVTIVVKGN